ncbi:MAG: alpha-E domain-containing protein [Bacteroidota bacterium]
MLSRVADTIFWMNRYVERAENYARFLDVNFNLSLEMPPNYDEQWRPLVVITGDLPQFVERYKKADKSSVIRFLGFDAKNLNSIYSSICFARENARSVRPELTKEVWEQVNALYHLVKDGTARRQWRRKDPRAYFMEIRKGCQLLYGLFDSTISRSEGWHYGKIGQLIERADKTSRVLDVKYQLLLPSVKEVGSTLEMVQWAALLKSVSAYDMYRKKEGKLVPEHIVGFLLFDPLFPRSVLSCLTRIETSLFRIAINDNEIPEELRYGVAHMKSDLMSTKVSDVFETGLHEYIDHVQMELNKLSNAICAMFRY